MSRSVKIVVSLFTDDSRGRGCRTACASDTSASTTRIAAADTTCATSQPKYAHFSFMPITCKETTINSHYSSLRFPGNRSVSHCCALFLKYWAFFIIYATTSNLKLGILQSQYGNYCRLKSPFKS